MAVVKRSDTDRISCGDILACLCVINYHGELGVKHLEHIHAVLTVHGENNLAVRAALECIFLAELFLCFFKSVKLAVAYCIASVQLKGLHSVGSQSHNRKTVKAEKSLARINDTAVVGTSGYRLVKSFFKFCKIVTGVAVTHN